MKVSVIIPAYNERENIKELLRHIDRFHKQNSSDWEFIIVDDGSTDGTYELLKDLHKDYSYVKIVKHRRNFGLTEALLSGFEHSSGDALVFFPADLQFRLEDVKRMADKLSEGYDLVAGKKKGKYEKKFVSSIYNTLSRKIFKVPVSDMNSIKIMKREIFELIPHRKGWHRYIVPIANEYGYKMTEIEVTLYPRVGGKSKFKGPWRIIVGTMDLLAVKFQLSFTKSPMLFFGTMSLISAILGTLFFLIAFVLRLMGHGFRPLLYATILFLIWALILLSMGSLGEMIAGLRDKPKTYSKHKIEEFIDKKRGV